jgi:hypothetical protein
MVGMVHIFPHPNNIHLHIQYKYLVLNISYILENMVRIYRLSNDIHLYIQYNLMVLSFLTFWWT